MSRFDEERVDELEDEAVDELDGDEDGKAVLSRGDDGILNDSLFNSTIFFGLGSSIFELFRMASFGGCDC